MRLAVARMFLLSCLVAGIGASARAASPTPLPSPPVELQPGLATSKDFPLLARVATDLRPIAGAAPMWLGGGRQVAVIGEKNQQTTILGFGGALFEEPLLLAADYGPMAAGGRLLDAAASPDGTALATATAGRDEKGED